MSVSIFSFFLIPPFCKGRLGGICDIGSLHHLWLTFPKEEVHASEKDKHRTQAKFAEIEIKNMNKCVMGFFKIKNVTHCFKIDKIY